MTVFIAALLLTEFCVLRSYLNRVRWRDTVEGEETAATVAWLQSMKEQP